MAYDETLRDLPRFNERELYEVPAIQDGQLYFPQSSLDAALKLDKTPSSPAIEEFARTSFELGRVVVVKESYQIPLAGGEHTVAWCRICDQTGQTDHHQIVCDHVAEEGESALSEELLFTCQAVREAIMIRSYVLQSKLGNTPALAEAGQTYRGRRGVIRFMLDYGRKQPHNWLVSHRSDVGLVDGFAALLDISPTKVRKTAKLMSLEGDIELTGPDNQVITPLAA
ncbi:MAG TPA: hypothetical protein VFP35_01885 [Candidatus Saccharimonadales bacterium]|nr:hypothetical protein [Candidatus Saccharimonadales bacterium]